MLSYLTCGFCLSMVQIFLAYCVEEQSLLYRLMVSNVRNILICNIENYGISYSNNGHYGIICLISFTLPVIGSSKIAADNFLPNSSPLNDSTVPNCAAFISYVATTSVLCCSVSFMRLGLLTRRPMSALSSF